MRVSVVLWVMMAVVLAAMVAQGMIYTKEKEDEMIKKYHQWCDKSNVHRCKYRQADFDYFQSLCNGSSPIAFSPRAITGSRTEYRCMSRSQREGYHNALRSMKSTNVGEQNEYDNLVVLHDGRTAPSAHFSPGFCAWHRIYLHLWERGIKKYCGNCFMPYWDSRLDSALGGNPQQSVIFSAALAGNANGVVTTGFSRNWRISDGCSRGAGRLLRRDFDSNTGSLYTDREVNSIRGLRDYYQLFFPWSRNFEFSHGFVHMAFGRNSHMSDILCSPFDPMFLAHHSFVEKMCDEVRTTIRDNAYPNVNVNPGNDFNNNVAAARGDLPVRPFNVGHLTISHAEALRNAELDPIWHRYERSPADTTCSSSSDCCSNGQTDFIFCFQRRCISKAQEGANIRREFPDEACYCPSGTPRNNQGRCQCG